MQRVQALAKRGLSGRAYWISGGSGQGKTTIGRLIAADVADEFMTREVDASALTVTELRELVRDSQVSERGAKTGRDQLCWHNLDTREPIPGYGSWAGLPAPVFSRWFGKDRSAPCDAAASSSGLPARDAPGIEQQSSSAHDQADGCERKKEGAMFALKRPDQVGTDTC